MADHHGILVIGGGNAGLSAAGRLARAGRRDVAVIEPREQHVFAPLQSHIAGGAARASEAVRPQGEVTPRHVQWIRDSVSRVDPVNREVSLASGRTLGYDHLVVAAGIEMRWDDVPGLSAATQRPTGVSNYRFDLAAKASPVLRDVRAGTVVFVQPAEPATCGGAAQKPMYLACAWWRAQGVLDDIRVVFVSALDTPHGIDEIDAELQRKLDEYGVETRYASDLLEVDADAHTVVVGRGDARETLSYHVLHAVPPQAPASWISKSGLAGPDGFVDVDPETLRHRRYDTVWSLGDAASVDTRRSGGAIRTQSQVLVRNLLSVLGGSAPIARYDGYTVVPYTVSRRTVVFAEFDRRGRLAPTVPGWRTLFRERRLSWIFDRRILPWVYWRLILQGRA